MNTPVNTLYKMMAIGLLCLAGSCANRHQTKITGVTISFPGDQVLAANVDVQTAEVSTASIQYWAAGQAQKPLASGMSRPGKQHRFLLPNLDPGQEYVFRVVTSGERSEEVSGKYVFRTIDFPPGQTDTFRVVCADTAALPAAFKEGYVMVYRREVPGLILLLDAKGNIVWHYQAKDAGFKVVQFTRNQTLLCLLGGREYETGYGNALLELSLSGDTLLYLKQGQNDLKQTLHHEVILSPKNELVTLCVEERVVDLRSRGGSPRDTVRGDGILVLDRQGRKKWKWTVFDALDPVLDEKILQSKKDWMHANSVAFDLDGNYLVSFYNNGQIWKVDAQTGRVIWKFGRNGDFEQPAGGFFDQAHAVHPTDKGWLLLFDNGGHNKLSRSLGIQLDESAKKAQLVVNTRLPPQLFSDRMGSSYLVGDNALLQCASSQKTVVLTNFRGAFLWQLKCNRMMSYRAVFIPKEKVDPYIVN